MPFSTLQSFLCVFQSSFWHSYTGHVSMLIHTSYPLAGADPDGQHHQQNQGNSPCHNTAQHHTHPPGTYFTPVPLPSGTLTNPLFPPFGAVLTALGTTIVHPCLTGLKSIPRSSKVTANSVPPRSTTTSVGFVMVMFCFTSATRNHSSRASCDDGLGVTADPAAAAEVADVSDRVRDVAAAAADADPEPDCESEYDGGSGGGGGT
ncbi:hypothetical protein ColTof3_07504 [Colletotrichum tofieldiae]|nr:hypothetical protein ColTof3_07504 [Colletotrichum tofieldiae]